MAYKYDVFVSYAHGFANDWLHEHFLPLFRWHLESAMGCRPKIFVDKGDISSGDTWPLRLKEALCHSKCLVPIWTPSYFQSAWCVCECSFILDRENECGFRTVEKPEGLIVPVNVSDGQSYPEFARNIHHLDCRDYFLIGPAFKETALYIELQQEIKEWSQQVASVLGKAPRWKRKWLEDPVTTIDDALSTKVKPPVLE